MPSIGSLGNKQGYWKLLILIVVFGTLLCAGHRIKTEKSGGNPLQEETLDGKECSFSAFGWNGQSGECTGGKTEGKSTFSFLFSESPMISSFLATAYISLFPNFILFFVPPNIRPSSLNILVSFAVGGLLGDVFLHLLPQAFLGEHGDSLSEESMKWRNVYVGLGIFGGFLFFFLMDKFMRLASGGGHSHSHSHHGESEGKSTAVVETDTQLRQRKKTDESEDKKDQQIATRSVNLSAYLNLIADMTHNFTDGLAIAASFYTSPAIGISTFAAVFFHEIPHEVGDYAILIQSGFSRSRALGAQFITAIGAFLGTVVGVAIEEATRNPDLIPILNGVLGSSKGDSIITASEMIIPATAGGFIYIATVGVIPELLEDSEQGTLREKLSDAFWQIVAMFVGVGLMVGITILEEM